MNGSIKVWAENRNASCGLSEFQKTQLQVVLDQHLQALEKVNDPITSISARALTLPRPLAKLW